MEQMISFRFEHPTKLATKLATKLVTKIVGKSVVSGTAALFVS
jgi:hypothetical protein